MNVENINFAIDVMKNAKNLQMTSFQDGDGDYVEACTIDDLHRCGNTACFVGYLSLTDKYKQFIINEYTYNTTKNLKVSHDGCIDEDYYDEEEDETNEYYNGSEYYLSKFLGIDNTTAHCFIYGDQSLYSEYSNFYRLDFSKVKPANVIEKLNLVLKGELK